MLAISQLDPEIEARIKMIEDRLAKLESSLIGASTGGAVPQGLEVLLIKNAGSIKTQDMIIISLRRNGSQTKEGIKKTLQDWGKVYGTWFDGGNFNGRLVKKNIVKKEGSNDDNEEYYSLTKRGEFIADELIQKVLANR